ncbi:hypothetical protein GCK32_008277 [Trichostrongylus colubriformis]|uniref:Uncharacterized protein n=1 Tax=Trichostrongylus colubriformis TaxID=6319 RepID=A0AAN8G3Q6_TRICO
MLHLKQQTPKERSHDEKGEVPSQGNLKLRKKSLLVRRRKSRDQRKRQTKISRRTITRDSKEAYVPFKDSMHLKTVMAD